MSSEYSSFMLSVKDVHDIAYEIAEEFEAIVSVQGIEATKSLIDKIIKVLEFLETSVEKIEYLEKKVSELKSRVSQLSSEKIFNDLARDKLKLTFEETEDLLTKECQNLNAIISTLKSENKFLKDQLGKKRENVCSTGLTETDIHDQENLILRLKSSLQKTQKRLTESDACLELLKLELDRTVEQNKILQSSNCASKKEIQELKLENYRFETKCENYAQKIVLLEQALADSTNWAGEQKEYYETLAEENRCMKHLKTNCEVDSILKERNELLERVKYLTTELLAVKNQSEKYKKKLFETMTLQTDKSIQESYIRNLFHPFLGFSTTSCST